MQAPKISVVIPSYNSADYVGHAIQSVIDQTYSNWEVVIVDDGSTDNTRDAVRGFLADSRVRYHYHSNRGVSAARNTGALVAEGEFLAFLDADDRLDPSALELMVEATSGRHASWCLCNVVLSGNSRSEFVETRLPNDLLHGILREDFVTRAPFFRKDDFLSLGMYDEQMAVREDWDINIRAIERGLTFGFVHKPIYIYQLRKSGASRNAANMLTYTERVLTKHHRRLASAGDSEASRILADNMWDLARKWFYETDDYARALVCALRSLLCDRNAARLFRVLGRRFRIRSKA